MILLFPGVSGQCRSQSNDERGLLGTLVTMVKMQALTRDIILAHCMQQYPLEACGMLLGDEQGIYEVYPARNEAQSARVFVVEPTDVVRAREVAVGRGLSVVGVYHSHTNSEAFPSATDVAQAPDPGWWYLVVSLARPLAELRCYSIRGGVIEELSIGDAEVTPTGAAPTSAGFTALDTKDDDYL
ncbi:MAG: M67 family metallopeptidase [Actinobacteria bacterium]|nr:M67 family metallopeptidase [Actinomycetota bacterium]